MSKGKVTCFYCQKSGHKANVCRKKKRDAKANIAHTNNSNKDDKDRAFSMVAASGNLPPTCHPRKFVLAIDSGASDHMVGTRDILTNVKTLECPVPVTVAESGRQLVAKEIGTLNVKLVVDGGEKSGEINNRSSSSRVIFSTVKSN